MEDRYEIRGKIGHGGLGSVYRGFDTKMNREVAIKRILTSEHDPSLKEEATKQLMSEAGALASLQHPNIVTVYDVGADEDGPYVVMELITGKTLDEIIEAAPVTWEDFREIAMQTQEALIAAQELNMIHSDLKPPNIMLTWLPSGKFQVKIVDFGLAILTQNQSQEEIEAMESVFGSIFFMPPEQFEREVLDARSDLYSIGCVYYQALTGVYPFNGESGNEVMDAHLNHTVRPIHEFRSDIPQWVCDWVMWQINRDRKDRPGSSREALANFIQNDKNPNPVMNHGVQVKRPRLIIPGAMQSSPSSIQAPSTMAESLVPPGSVAASSTTRVQPMVPDPATDVHKVKTSPQSLIPSSSVHTSTSTVRTTTSTVGLTATTVAGSPAGTATQQVYVSGVGIDGRKTGMSQSLKITIGGVLLILVVITGWLVMTRMEENERNRIYSAKVALGADESVKEVPMTADEVRMMLDSVSVLGKLDERGAAYQALAKATASDGTDIDSLIVEYATADLVHTDVRQKLLSEVIRPRQSPAMVSKLMEFALKTPDQASAVAAYDAIRKVVNDDHADEFLTVITGTEREFLRPSAEKNLAEIINNSKNRLYLAKRISNSYESAKNQQVRQTLMRLMGSCSTLPALDMMKQTLKGTDPNDQIAAISALAKWQDLGAFDVLLGYLVECKDSKLRSKAFDAIVSLASQPFATEDEAKAKELWTKMGAEAKLAAEKQKVIRGVGMIEKPWVISMIQPYTKDPDKGVAQLAEKGIQYVKERDKLK